MHRFLFFLFAIFAINDHTSASKNNDIKKPTYNIDVTDSNDALRYSNLFTGLQQTPISPLPYSGSALPSSPLLTYNFKTDVPGYPASTGPLYVHDISGRMPYIGGLFGFENPINKILPKKPRKDRCPPGYAKMFGDVPGWGTSLGSKIQSTRQECANRCSSYVDCLSFEHSNTEHLCNLNTVEAPTSRNYRDYTFCSKIQKLDNSGNVVDQVLGSGTVSSGNRFKIINENIEKFQQQHQGQYDENEVLTNMTLCYFTGDDILKSHLMFNDRWKFDRYNLEGLKRYVNDLTFGANIHLGQGNYLLKWRGPFKRSDAGARYPGMMEKDTKRSTELGVCDAVVFLVFNDFKAQELQEGHKFSGFVKGEPCDNHRGEGYMVMVDQGYQVESDLWVGPQILAHQLLRLLTADVCAGRKSYAQETMHWDTNCFCENKDSLLHPYLKPGDQYLDQCVIDKLNLSQISVKQCLLPDRNKGK